MPVFVTQMLTMVGGVLAGMVAKALSARVIETAVLAGVKVLVDKTDSKVDDQIYREVYTSIKGVEPPK